MSKKPGDWWNESLNLIEGCMPISEACEHCWALAMLHRFRGQNPGQFKIYPCRVDVLEQWRKPRRIFVGSLTDMLCKEAWPYLMMIIRRAHHFPRHTFIILTKRPHLIEEFKKGSGYHAAPYSFYMDNIWFGITTENQERFDERWSVLEKHPFKTRFLHLEPLLGPVDITPALPHTQWVVVGGENGPGARPMNPWWVRSIRDQCVEAGIPFWYKSGGYWYPVEERWFGHGAPIHEKRPWLQIGGPETETPYLIFEPAHKHMDFLNGNNRRIDGCEWNELPGGAK